MKNRILSVLLAVVMVLSLTAVFTFATSADEAAGLEVKVGNVYATADSEAYVDVYVSASYLPETHDHLRNWQFTFEGATILESAEQDGFYVSKGAASLFTNVASCEAGNSSATGADCGTAAQITARGGWKVASVKFAVPDTAAAGDEIEIKVAAITALSFEDTDLNVYKEIENVKCVPGKIIVVDNLTGIAPAYEGEGEDYTIPALTGTTVNSKLTKNSKLTGEIGTLVIPATIQSIASSAFAADSIDKIVVKDLNCSYAIAGLVIENAETAVYYLKAANGSDTTAETMQAYFDDEAENEPDIANLLQASAFVDVDEQNVTFVAGLAADDLGFENLYVSVTITGEGVDRVFEAKVSDIYRTVKANGSPVASVNETTAAAIGENAFISNCSCIAGLTIKGVPAGEYTATVTLYGTTAAANGTIVTVVSETVEGLAITVA